MRHSQRVGTGLVPVIAGLALCATSIAVIAYHRPPVGKSPTSNYDNIISANAKTPHTAVIDRAVLIAGVVNAFRAEIDGAVYAARPAGDPIEKARYARFMDGFKAELYAGLRAHLDTYSDTELHSLTKPQWDLAADDLEVGERFREWLRDSAPQIVDRVYDEQKSAGRSAHRNKDRAAQPVSANPEGSNRGAEQEQLIRNHTRPLSGGPEKVSADEDFATDQYSDRAAAQSRTGKRPITHRTAHTVMPLFRPSSASEDG